MTTEDRIELENGLTFFYENQREFDHKKIPVERQVALGWAAGHEAGKSELRAKVVKIFKISNREWT